MTESALPRVLVVDDDSMILPLLRRWAVLAGYEPVAAADGPEAIEAWRRHANIVAVVTDVRMSGMDGRKLVSILRNERPDLPVVFISGFTGSAEAPDLEYRPFAAFVAKPFRFKDLDDALTSVTAA